MHDAHDSTPAPRLLGGRALRIRLAGGGLLFLVLGAAAAPAARPTTLSTSEERPAPLLEEQLQQRLTVLPFRGVGEIAGVTRSYGIAILAPAQSVAPVWSDYASVPRRPSLSGFGVFVNESFALTHASALGGRLTANVSTPDGRTFESTVAAYDAPTELVLLRVPGASVAPAVLAAGPVTPGTLGAGVGHREGRDIVLPVFFASLDGERLITGEAAAAAAPGLPIFTLDGELAAITAGSGAREAIAVAPATARLLAQATGQGLPASLGITVQEVPRLLRPLLGEKGALISHVIPGGPAEKAGIEAGQVLTRVDDMEVGTAATMTAASDSLRVDAVAHLTLGVNGRAVQVEVTPATIYDVAALARAARLEPVVGVPLKELLLRVDLQAAGLPPDGLVQRIGGRRVESLAAALREVRRARRPLALHLYHEGIWFFAGVDEPQ
jgi:serine protease Do